MNFNIFRRVFIIAVLGIFLGLSFGNVAKAEVKAKTEADAVYIFTAPTCPHCKDAERFLKEFKKEKYPDLKIYDFNIALNYDLAKEYYQAYFVPVKEQGLVPAIFVGNEYHVGFSDKIGEDIISQLGLEGMEEKKEGKDSKSINFPIIGEVGWDDFSLPVLAITLGIADGFNVCSLGALMVILGLVIFLGSRKKIFIVGGLFIVTTAIVYGILIFLWHQLFSVIALYARSLEMLIGLLSLAGGFYLLREFYKTCKAGPVCSSNNLLSRLTPKIERVLKNKSSWWIILGAVVIFSAVVTIIEFPCSAVLPVLFSGYLVNSEISFGMALFYMAIYVLFYLLDEVIIFLIAVITLKIKIVSPKFIIFFNLLAALIFIFLGTYYLFF